MNSQFFPPWTASTETPTCSGNDCPSCECQKSSLQDVGADRLSHNLRAVEDELDRCIAELYAASRRSFELHGDSAGARIYLERADVLRKSRSPEHQQRLQERAWQRMVDADPCYFSACGERDAAKGSHGR